MIEQPEKRHPRAIEHHPVQTQPHSSKVTVNYSQPIRDPRPNNTAHATSKMYNLSSVNAIRQGLSATHVNHWPETNLHELRLAAETSRRALMLHLKSEFTLYNYPRQKQYFLEVEHKRRNRSPTNQLYISKLIAATSKK